MAKKGGKSKGFISQGAHSNVSKKLRNAMRSDYMKSGDRLLNQQAALAKGKDIVMTIPNPNKEDKSRAFIKVRISGRDHLAKLKNSGYQMKSEPV